VHQTTAVIGDFQERNILVSSTARVTLVDCDSMQFADSAGRQFLCGVARPEFSAPELAATDLRRESRARASDLFALAVHIHLLLMGGNHPFLRGTWAGAEDQPDAMTLAKGGHWAGGPDSMLSTHPLAPPPSFLPVPIQHLFVRALSEGARNPPARPTAAEWRRALLSIQVTMCQRGHEIPLGCTDCPWCRIDDQRARRREARVAATPVAAQIISKIGPPPPSVAAPSSLVPPAPPPTGRRPSRRSLIFLAVGVSALIAAVVAVVPQLVSPAVPTKTNKAMPSTAVWRPTGFAPTPPPVGSGTTLGLPDSFDICPVESTRTFRHVGVPPTASCADAPAVLEAANQSEMALGAADIWPVRLLVPGRYTMACTAVSSLVICRGEGSVAYLW
jgi:DNA-binding helix-hairpin-helix protein with protein kinase domain